MMSAGRKDNAEAQRTRSFAEQEHEMRLPRGSADFAEVWESDRDGGLGTSWIALFVRPRSGGASRFLPRTCGGSELRRMCRPCQKVTGPRSCRGEPRRIQRTREARELKIEYMTA